MGFLTEYIQGFMPVSCQVWDVKEEEGISGEVIKGASKLVELGWALWDIAHHYVLTNTIAMVTWIKYWINLWYKLFCSCQQEILVSMKLHCSFRHVMC